MASVMFVLLAIGGGPVGLFLVFAATPKEMALLYALSGLHARSQEEVS